MRTLNLFIILLALSINLRGFYISKHPLPTLFLNQQFTFNITHNAPENVNFVLISAPSFLTLTPNGHLHFLPKTQGSFQLIIQAINASTNTNLLTLSYLLTVLDKQKQLTKSLWIFDQENYFAHITTKTIRISSDSFDFHSPIMTNQNIRLKLKTSYDFGQLTWFYENLPPTIIGSRSTGLIQGFVEKQGNYIIKATAIDSSFKLGQIYIFLKFVQTPMSLQQDSYSQYNWRSAFLVQQKQQNAKLLENEIKNLVTIKNSFKSKRNQVLGPYKSKTVLRQQNKSIEDGFTQKIKLKNDELTLQQIEREVTQSELKNQKSEVELSRKQLSDEQKEYGRKAEESRRVNLTHQIRMGDLRLTKVDEQKVKKQVMELEDKIYNQENELKNIKFQKQRANVSFISWQREEVRTRQILEVRKNIEFEYLMKKAQTDNKVRSARDFMFLAQSNYDFAYAEYKRQSLLYFQHVIETTSLQSQIDLALKDYHIMNKTLNRLKLNYAIAEGAVNTLNVAKQQLSKLSAFALNSTVASDSTYLNDTQMIQAQARLEVEEYPFTGCAKIGNFAWAGSGKIKDMGKNWIMLGSEQILNFGKCTSLKTNVKPVTKLELGQWIQFAGYYWDGVIQATSITLLSLN